MMKKISLVFTILLLFSSHSYERGLSLEDSLQFLFEAGTEGYECFRIPAIVTAKNGTLLAFAEGRKDGCSDTGDIDLVMKRSTDGGLSWSKLQVIWDDGDHVCGNPAPVVDEQSGVIHLLATWNLGEDSEGEIIDGTSRDTRRIFVLKSEDDGMNWSEPNEITRSVKSEDWSWYATGPGHGIQLQKGPNRGRLLIACDHIEKCSRKYFSHVIFSDDGGITWELGGSTQQDQVNECMAAELPDGRIILNMRNYDRSRKTRKVAFSEDGGMSWSALMDDPVLVEPICQASLLMVPSHSGERPLLLFLNPADETERKMMTLRSSTDHGRNWTGTYILFRGPSAYSDMTGMDDGMIYCLFEAGNLIPYEGIVFQQVSFQHLLN